jgi:hypothetical protein
MTLRPTTEHQTAGPTRAQHRCYLVEIAPISIYVENIPVRGCPLAPEGAHLPLGRTYYCTKQWNEYETLPTRAPKEHFYSFSILSGCTTFQVIKLFIF